ncbi:MAG TPA: MFS transporter, partial [Thermomicrobiales bacterium]|nr:MFS transporter [Thermomicrobiales bacterium]
MKSSSPELTPSGTAPQFVVPLYPRVVVLGISQILAWGATFNLPGVLGRPITNDLDLSLTIVLAGPTVMLVILAMVSWFLTSRFERHGARSIMIGGTILAAIGVMLLALSQNLASYMTAWIVLGFAGAGVLTTAAQIAIAEIAGPRAKQAIGLLALFGALSSPILWPIVNALQATIGWRSTTALLAACLITISLPLLWWALPPSPDSAPETDQMRPGALDSGPARTPLNSVDFALVAIASAANGFITWGFSLTLVVLFEERQVSRDDAVALASFIGLASLAARALDYLGGRRWSGLTTGVAASLVLPVSYLVLLAGSGYAVALTFVVLYGLAGGAMAVARSTIPLAIFPRDAYARASARLALPLNLAYAA